MGKVVKKKCYHRNRKGPYYSAAKSCQWFVCRDCGLWARRDFGVNRVRVWGKIRMFSPMRPDEALTRELEEMDIAEDCLPKWLTKCQPPEVWEVIDG